MKITMLFLPVFTKKFCLSVLTFLSATLLPTADTAVFLCYLAHYRQDSRNNPIVAQVVNHRSKSLNLLQFSGCMTPRKLVQNWFTKSGQAPSRA